MKLIITLISLLYQPTESYPPLSLSPQGNPPIIINQAQDSEVILRQSGTLVPLIQETEHIIIQLKPTSLEINTVFNQIYLCLSDEDDFIVYSGMNSHKEAESCLFLYNYFASSPKADYLFVDSFGSNSLNISHGMQKKDSRYSLKVNRFIYLENKQEIYLSNMDKTLYGLLWIDKDLDGIVDAAEYNKLQFKFIP